MDGGDGKKNGGGGSEGILFFWTVEQSAELLRVGPNWQPQLRPFSNQSISHLFVNWLIDWLEDWLTGWLGPQLPPFGGFWGRKSVSKPIWIHLQRDFKLERSHFGAKNKPSRCICRFGFGFKFTKQGSKRGGHGCGKIWKLGFVLEDWVRFHQTIDVAWGLINLTSGFSAWFGSY